MGKNTKKSNQTNGTKIITSASVVMTALSPVFFWTTGLVNTYYDVTGFRFQYSALLLASALFAFVGFIVSLIASFKVARRKKYIYILCALITLSVALLELTSVALLNSLT